MTEITQVLKAIDQGDANAAAQLLPLVYEELRKLAKSRLANEQPGQTLQPTALVHEAYLRLLGDDAEPRWQNRAHFFAAAAEAMRRILIDVARRKSAVKHGGDRIREPLEDMVAPEKCQELLSLDEALSKLAAQDPVKARLVELRYFAGLTGDDAAKVLGISPATADRYWAFARAWLHSEVRGD
ncbi:MAG: sigma-70 family RNA polymerase sigma factor [Planctomycetes bacterium]|jgi:RNA polymerase sigma factor (TIGR02999 family)|nr:sigma-70 family RNA polymerase sigma factor [Planctomycetota bacterium]